MKSKFLFLFLLLFSIRTFGQTQYSNGFQVGYKEGFCYNDFGCISPIPPITPIPYIGENSTSYQDGYNRGFKLGLEDKAAKKAPNSSGYPGYSNPNIYNSNSTSTSEDDFFIQLLLMQQKAAQQKEYEKEQALAQMQLTRQYYSSVQKYPDSITRGWHNVIVMNDLDFCKERKVYVENNKITRYIIDDWIERKVAFNGPINSGRSLIKLYENDSIQGGFIDVYFIDDINNPQVIVSPPIVPGKISFWTNWKNSGNLELYFEGMYVGKFTSYFAEDSPVCGQHGTLTVTYKPGTYHFRAVAGNKTWNGTVVITSSGCALQELIK